MSKPKVLTTAAGIPVCDNQTSLTAGDRGPTLLQDHHLLEKLAHFNRERIHERVVHAKAAGAHGTFIVTNDITRYTKARIFSEVGKKTDVFGRFSTVAGEKGSADTVRDVRGFAGIERKGKMIYKSIKKKIGFGLLAIFGYYLVCLLLPTLANAQASITTTDKKYITKAAKDALQKFQDKTIDSLLPDYICSTLEQYRELLKQATKIDKLNDTEIKKLADECEKIFNDLYNTVQKEKINEEKTGRRGSIDDCLSNCESTHSRRIKQTDKHDWFGRFNCNLDASSCVIGCYVDVANNARQKGGIPKD